MSHGTIYGHRAPSSKIGRNTRKCDRYAGSNQRAKNATRRDTTAQRRWERDNNQRVGRLAITLQVMRDAGVGERSVAFGDVMRQMDKAVKQRAKYVGGSVR